MIWLFWHPLLRRLCPVEVTLGVSLLLWGILDYPSASAQTPRCATKGGLVSTPKMPQTHTHTHKAEMQTHRHSERSGYMTVSEALMFFFFGLFVFENHSGVAHYKEDWWNRINRLCSGYRLSTLVIFLTHLTPGAGKWVWFMAIKPSTEKNMAERKWLLWKPNGAAWLSAEYFLNYW